MRSFLSWPFTQIRGCFTYMPHLLFCLLKALAALEADLSILIHLCFLNHHTMAGTKHVFRTFLMKNYMKEWYTEEIKNVSTCGGLEKVGVLSCWWVTEGVRSETVQV